MRQRHAVPFLCTFFAFWLATVIAWWLVMDHLRTQRKPLPFVDPVIWREPFTDGEPQLQPDI